MVSVVVTTNNIGFQFQGSLSNAKKKKTTDKAGVFLNLSFNSSHNTNTSNKKRRFPLLVTASSNGSPQKEVTEKRKKKGTIHETEAFLTARKLANESAEHTTLVTFLRGTFVEDKFVYRQIFVIRSYEIGPDKTFTMETLMSFLQEAGINHVSNFAVSGSDFAVTPEMNLRKLIWVASRIQVQVQRYSKWGDEIEVDTWFDAAGKNGMRRDFIIRDHYTKEIIARATSTWVTINRETRRLSKMPEEVRQEIAPFQFNRRAFANEETDCKKIDKLTNDTTERIKSGLAPGWNDMDVNQHVNNVKYIGWILESMPEEVLRDYKMTNMTLEFRRECTQSSLLESMTSPTTRVIGASNNDAIAIDRKTHLQYTHLLRLQHDKAELVRARTEWHLKQKHK